MVGTATLSGSSRGIPLLGELAMLLIRGAVFNRALGAQVASTVLIVSVATSRFVDIELQCELVVALL